MKKIVASPLSPPQKKELLPLTPKINKFTSNLATESNQPLLLRTY
jgi:hypothetical protein